MFKKIHKPSIENTIVFLLFLAGFFWGGTLFGDKTEFLCRLGANPALLYQQEKASGGHIETLAQVLPLIDVKKQKEEIIPPSTNYTPDIPVLAREKGEKIQIKNDTSYPVDVDKFLETENKVSGGVLIIHTHTSEAYLPEGENTYVESDPFRTQDVTKNIVYIGDIVENVLKENKIKVIHDKTIHDYPSYTGSYKRALTKAQSVLNENEEIDIVLDIHRDALQSESGEYMKTIADDGCAQAMIVIGTDGSGLVHDNWRKNLALGIKLQKIANDTYPSLMRPIHLCNERYNGHMSQGAMILEIGSNMNTLPEAGKCAQLLGECIVKLVKEYRERQ